jgi:hypothetical protein
MLAGFFVALLSGHIYILIICKFRLVIAYHQLGHRASKGRRQRERVEASFSSTGLRYRPWS